MKEVGTRDARCFAVYSACAVRMGKLALSVAQPVKMTASLLGCTFAVLAKAVPFRNEGI